MILRFLRISLDNIGGIPFITHVLEERYASVAEARVNRLDDLQ